MSTEVLIIAGIILLLVVLFLLKKISGAIKAILSLVVLIGGFACYVLFVPASAVSIWFTENIATAVTLDAEDKYVNGEVIFTYSFNSAEDKNEDEEPAEVDPLTSSLQDIAGTMNSFLAERIEAIASKYIELQEEYTLSFSDSYLIMTPDNYSMTIEIIKGSLPEET